MITITIIPVVEFNTLQVRRKKETLCFAFFLFLFEIELIFISFEVWNKKGMHNIYIHD